MAESDQRHNVRIMKKLITVILILIVICLLTSCGQIKYVPVESVRIEYKTRDSIKYDSIYKRDSIHVIVKGDTVTVYKDKYLYKYKFINRTDTVLITDTIKEPYPVEKRLSKWQEWKIKLGDYMLILIIVAIIFISIRIFRK